ncbi:DUF6770 family protein [Flavobacterium sp. UBA6135]|uniref:DUF6770 family protein n=1 Tax=Flavobacterium sp. UBA6135 TaxID=1946553 RepID=UPI0025BC32AB|nr:DUF6770 family protein [Flavobacterium sp. UBA6135]
MKKTLLFCTMLFCLNATAQINRLSEISSGKMLDSEIIYENKGEDVYGYLLLYQKDIVEKNKFELEVVLLDKNLNKVSSAIFEKKNTAQMKNFILIQAGQQNMKQSVTKMLYAVKMGDKIVICMIDRGVSPVEEYIDLDLKTNTLSEPYCFVDFKTYKRTEADLKDVSFHFKTKTASYISDNFFAIEKKFGSNPNKPNYRKKSTLHFYDKDFNTLFEYKYDKSPTKNGSTDISVVADNENYILCYKTESKKDKDKKPFNYFVIIDKNNGVEKSTIKFESDLYDFSYGSAKFVNNEVHFSGHFRKKGSVFSSKKHLGFYHGVFDIETGKQKKLNVAKFTDFASYYKSITPNGNIKKEGYLHPLHHYYTKEGKLVMVTETFSDFKNPTIGNMYLLEFDSNMKISTFQKIDKTPRTYKYYRGNGYLLAKFGLFDYLYAQKLQDVDNGFVLFYANNEKEGKRGKKKPDYKLGIVTYIDGKFENEKISLKTSDGQIYPMKAKNGYIMLREVSNNDVEFRLEKINY